jgi:FeS assembly SUF system protein
MTDASDNPPAMDRPFPMFHELDMPGQDPSEFRARRGAPLPDGQAIGTREDAIASLKTVYDPEIPVDIWELGLIYTIDINDADGSVFVEMTLTAPGCPVAGEMPGMAADALVGVQGFGEIEVILVFDPPWTDEKMSDEARVALDWF